MALGAGFDDRLPPGGGRVVALHVYAAGCLVLTAAVFGLGYALGQTQLKQVTVRVADLQFQAARLSEQLAAAEEAVVRLERSHLVDRETKRSAQERLKSLQAERLQLAKRNVYLRGLVREGATGTLHVADVFMEKAPSPGEYRYRITLIRSGAELKRFSGVVRLRVAIGDDDAEAMFDSRQQFEVASHNVDFLHLENLRGTITYPAGAKTVALAVKVFDAEGREQLASFTFNWVGGDELLPSPDDRQKSATDRTFGP
jgi:hypothetical protein